MQIEHISDTARWVAFYRALETARPDAVFRDPFAARLAGERGRQITDAMPNGRANGWPMVVRTAVMDEIVLRLVRSGEVDLVLNLAAGLDARPWRLELPPALRWVDVDLPEMLEYKTGMLNEERPACRYQAVPADLRDPGARQTLLSRLSSGAKQALVMTEGLLIYLRGDEVAVLARDLHAQPPLRWWLSDLASPRLLKMLARTWGPRVAAGNAPFQFGPAEGPAFFEPYGWREAESRAMMEEALRLGRLHLNPLARLLSRLAPHRIREEWRRLSLILLLERL